MKNTEERKTGFLEAISFLGCKLTEKALAELEALVKTEMKGGYFSCHGVCILWHRNKRFVEFCKKHQIEFGKKEIIICTNYVRATNDFHQVPHLIFEGPVFWPNIKGDKCFFTFISSFFLFTFLLPIY